MLTKIENKLIRLRNLTLSLLQKGAEGITHFKHIRTNNELKSFQALVSKFRISSGRYLEHMQTKSIIRGMCKFRLEQTMKFLASDLGPT